MNIGNKIQKHREKNGLSQEMLAEKLGVSRQSVSKWELNQSLPEVDKIVAMSKLFGVTTDELLIEPQGVEIKIIKAEKYEDVNKILELFQKSATVIVNCEETDEEVKKQIIDRLTSEIEIMGGQIQKISPNTYVCCPKNIHAAKL